MIARDSQAVLRTDDRIARVARRIWRPGIRAAVGAVPIARTGGRSHRVAGQAGAGAPDEPPRRRADPADGRWAGALRRRPGGGCVNPIAVA
jgi:hypothetical protein